MDELNTDNLETPYVVTGTPESEDYSDIQVGRTYGYFKILKKAGRNRFHQQEYIVRCSSCHQIFTKTLYKIKEAEGLEECRHTHRTTKPATEPHPCAYCGEMTTNIKYCTAKCRAAAVNKATKTKPPLLCKVCGKPTPSRTQEYCSSECRRIHRLEQMYGVEVEVTENANYRIKEGSLNG